MPWEKKFDENKVLNEAMKAFWQNGFDGTSMKQLIGCMGLNPGSIYAAFGDKKALFGRTMDCYTDMVRQKHREMKQDNSPRSLIMTLIDEMVTTIKAGSAHNGCFMVNTALDIAPQDKEIRHFISQWFEELEEFFETTLKAAQKAGEVRPDLDTGKAARHIIALISGVQVLARVNPQHQAVDDIKEQVENILG